MSDELDRRLAQLRKELDALTQIKTQEDFDEGARLHAEKNAPWVAGAYTHLRFEPYRYQEFPKMLYGLDYVDAVQAYAEAELMPAFGANDLERKQALLLAERRVHRATCIVKSEGELRKLGSNWYESPIAVLEAKKGFQRDIEVADAHRAYEDRNLTGRAKRERDAAEEGADGFVPEIREQRRAPATRTKVKVGR